MAVLWALGAALCWGAWGLTSAMAARRGTSIGLVAGSTMLQAMFWLPASRGAVRSLSAWLVASAVFGAAAYASYFHALRLTDRPVVVIAVTALYPAFAYLLLLATGAERLSWRMGLGIVLAVAALVLLAGETHAATPG